MARYTPGNPPTDAASIAAFLREELSKIAQAMETPNERFTWQTLSAVPNKYGEGTTVKADGTNWDPGSGAGTYQYRGGAWRFLG